MTMGACLIIAAVAHYAVSPMSETPYLPEETPSDGEKGGVVRIVAAKDEYEPGSFVLRADEDLGRVKLELGDFLSEKGERFPAANLDLRVVKVWWQNRNAWHSYFGDCGWKLCPELLLRDEELIEVERTAPRNYARIVRTDGSTFRKWLNPPKEVDPGFQCMRPEFADAKTIQPIRIEANRSKQIFLTAHVTREIKAGLYKGAVKAVATAPVGGAPTVQCEVPVEIRVLDFTLPEHPGTYDDPWRDLHVSAYDRSSIASYAELNGGDLELARRQLRKTLVNYVAHGQDLYKNPARNDDETVASLEVIRKAGMRQDVFNGAVRVKRFKDPESHVGEMREHARHLAKLLDDTVGHHNVYIGYGDEPGDKWLVANRPVFDVYRAEGFRFFIAGGDGVFNKCGWCYDWHNVAKPPEDDSSSRLWAQLPYRPCLAWYAFQHTGPENPGFNRRQYGFAAYLSGYTVLCNLGNDIGPKIFNDDTVTYRPLIISYRSADGVLDTLEWEGFREGIDDMRYATLMKRMAVKTAELGTSEARVAANQAAMALIRADRTRDDLDCLRGEVIRQIGKLSRFVNPASVVADPLPTFADSSDVFTAPLPKCKLKKDVCENVNLVNPEPTNVAHMAKKEYAVEFSDRAISGLGDWELLSKRPEIQKFDRRYKGGSLDFMETDVATGDRGMVAKGAKSLKYSELQIAADEWGVHFRFEAFSDKAPEAAAGIGSMGSFESYLAPGGEHPHECFMLQLGSATEPHVWHSQYDRPGYRRSREKDRNSYRQEVRFTDVSAVAYSAFSWEQFYYAIPRDGDCWDFEVFNWGPVKSAWNGAESIHGRSTWGRLRFRLSPADRLRIFRRLVHFAVRDFRAEFSSRGSEGIVSRMLDAATGDPDFYNAEVKPIADELETAAQRAVVGMDDATVAELAEKYLARWRDFRFLVQKKRAEYLKGAK